MADLFEIWKERVERALSPEETEKKRATFSFKKDEEFHDISGRECGGIIRRGLTADMTVALRSHSFEPTNSSSVNRESMLYSEALFKKSIAPSSKIKISRRDLFLPPQSEIDAVDKHCDELQKAALADVVKRSREKHDKQAGILKDRVLKLVIPGSSGKNWTEDDYHAMLLWIRDEAPIIIHIPFESDERLEKLTRDTHFRNQFETRISRGTLDFSEGGSRHGWESRIFKKHYDTAKPFQRPKYGCLNIVNDPIGISCATCYGSSYIILKGCRLRTSFADKDSSCSDVEIASCEYHAHVLSRYTDQELNRVLEVATRRRLWHDSDIIINYKEVQIHGELSLCENIDLVVIDASFEKDKTFLSKVEIFCRKNNCNYVVMPVREKKKEFDGNIWSMAGGVEPEGFLATDPRLPSFLASDDFSKTTSTAVKWTTGEKVFVKIGATCRPGIVCGSDSAFSYTVKVAGSRKVFTSEQISDSQYDSSDSGTYVLCEGDLVHAARNKSTIAPGEVLRVSKDSSLVAFEDSLRKAVRISNNRIFKTGAPLRVFQHEKRWSAGNRVSVHLMNKRSCEVGTVTNVDTAIPNQYSVTLDSGLLIACLSHHMADEPDIKISGSESKDLKIEDMLKEGHIVHARLSHVGIFEGVVSKTKLPSSGSCSVKIWTSDSSSGYKVITVPYEEISIVGDCHSPVEGVIRTYGTEPTVSVYGVPYIKDDVIHTENSTPWMEFDMFTEVPSSFYDTTPICGGVSLFGVLHEGILTPNFDLIPTSHPSLSEIPKDSSEATSFCHWMEADYLFNDHISVEDTTIAEEGFSLFNDKTTDIHFVMGGSSFGAVTETSAEFDLFNDDVPETYESTLPRKMSGSEASWMAGDKLFGDSELVTSSSPKEEPSVSVITESVSVSLQHDFDDVIFDNAVPFSPPDRLQCSPPEAVRESNRYTNAINTAINCIKNDSCMELTEYHLSEQYAALTEMLKLVEAQREKIHKSLNNEVASVVKVTASCAGG